MAVRSRFVPLLAVIVLGGCGGEALVDEGAEARLRAALDRVVSLQADNERLDVVLAGVAKREGLRIDVDRKALKTAGVAPETRVSIRLKDLPLRWALEHLLQREGLTYVPLTDVEGGRLLVTTSRAGQPLVGRVYPVVDLLDANHEFTVGYPQASGLKETVKTIVAIESWDDAGGEGTVAVLPGALKVLQTPAVHAEIEVFLAGARRLASADGLPEPRAAAAEAAIRQALAQDVVPNYSDLSLVQFSQLLADEHGINVVLDAREIYQPEFYHLTMHLTREIPLASAWNLAFSQFDCNWTVYHGALLITDADAENYLDLRFYATDDLTDAVEGFDEGELLELIEWNVMPERWFAAGGPGAVARVPGGLAVRQTPAVHEAVARLLAELRRARDPRVVNYDERGDSPLELAIDRALNEPFRREFIQEPLEEVCRLLAEDAGVDIFLDRRSLDEVGIGTDTPLTLYGVDVSLRSALDLMLRAMELDWTIAGDVLVVRHAEQVAADLRARVYRVSEMPAPRTKGDNDELLEVIKLVDRDSWDDHGGAGTASNVGTAGDLLVVTQTRRNHAGVRRLLDDLYQAMELPSDEYGPPLGTAREEAIARALAASTSIDVVDTPLKVVLEVFAARHGIPICIDRRALDDIGVGSESTVTLTLKDVSLAFALDRLLEPLKLGWAVRDDYVGVTAREIADAVLPVRVYRAEQLLGEGEVGEFPESLVWGADAGEHFQDVVSPDSWARAGGYGLARWIEDPGLFVVSHNRRGHADVERFLAGLRQLYAGEPAAVLPKLTLGEQRRRELLRAVVETNPVGERLTLCDALAALTDAAGMQRPVFDVTPAWLEKRLIDARLPQLPLAEGLDALLDRANRDIPAYDLGWLVRGQAPLITTSAQKYGDTRIYRLPEPLRSMFEGDSQKLAEGFCEAHAAPGHWRGDGAYGTMASVPGGWVVYQTPEGHREFERFLAALGRACDHDAPAPQDRPRAPAEQKLQTALNQDAQLECNRLTLTEVLERLRAAHDVQFVGPQQHPAKRVSADVAGVTLGELLDYVLGPLELGWSADYGRIVIWADDRRTHWSTEFYDVGPALPGFERHVARMIGAEMGQMQSTDYHPLRAAHPLVYAALQLRDPDDVRPSGKYSLLENVLAITARDAAQARIARLMRGLGPARALMRRIAISVSYEDKQALLSEALRDATPLVRATALAALGDAATQEDLVRVMQDRDALVRIIALEVMFRRDPDAQAAAAELVGDPHPLIRRAVVEWIALQGRRQLDFMPQLALALGDGQPRIRRRAAVVLASLGPSAVPTLLNVIRHDDRPFVIESMSEVVKNSFVVFEGNLLRERLFVDLVRGAPDDAPVGERGLTVGPAARAVLPGLVRFLDETDDAGLRCVLEFLGTYGSIGGGAFRAVQQALDDPDPRVRDAAQQAWHAWSPPRSY